MAGKNANCYVGPGKYLSNYQNSKGEPVAVAYRDRGTGNNDKIDLKSPLEGEHGSNLFISNYFNPTDFQRFGVETGTFPLADKRNIPLAFKPVVARDMANPYYEFVCADTAEDTIARIRVLIRSWDTVTNFTAKSNPYTDPTTLEPGFNSDYILHDRSVWTDMSPTHPNATRGDQYPGMDF
jgi:hypothetical protein